MKQTYLMIPLFVIGTTIGARAQSGEQDSTGLPGDNFSLQGALELFKEAKSPEAFEKMLNTESNHVNNLDLNKDGKIDYIRVIDKQKGDAHALILQTPISKRQSQDIAVIEIEKTGDDTASVQIVGDKDLYGEEKVVEPKAEENDSKGPALAPDFYEYPSGIFVNAWFWPSVQFMYAPGYSLWVSPWYWDFYPDWWYPWYPMSYSAFYPFVIRYRPLYVYAPAVRLTYAHSIYAPYRTRSFYVRSHNAVVINNYRTMRAAPMRVRTAPAPVYRAAPRSYGGGYGGFRGGGGFRRRR